MKDQGDILMLTLDHLRVLASNACSDVMSAFDPFTPMSAGDVGSLVGRSPGAVSEHIQKLLSVGLIIEAGTRKKRSRTEQLYLPAGKIIRFQMLGQTQEALDAYMDRVRGKLRLMERSFEGVLDILLEDESILDFLIYKTYTVHLDRERALRLKIATDELLGLLKSYAKDPKEGGPSDKVTRFNFVAIGLPAPDELRSAKGKK